MDSTRGNFLKGIGLGVLIAVVIGIGGYLFLRGDQSEFGLAMFIGVPFASGFAVAAVVRKPKRIAGCCLIGGILTLSILLFTGWEGIVCCVMALPLVSFGVWIGAVLGYRVRGRFIDELASNKLIPLLLLFCPFFIAAADRLEQPVRSVQQHEVFTTEAIISASPERTWDLVSEMQSLDGPRPFLLRVGLPIPTSCELDKMGVGGHRVCHFHNGKIEQEVTEWARPSTMGLRIVESTLPGRHWLSFIDASYELHPTGAQTRIVRHTTIGTRLYPRWYWRPLERWGVTSEHEFVFANLKRWTATPQ